MMRSLEPSSLDGIEGDDGKIIVGIADNGCRRSFVLRRPIREDGDEEDDTGKPVSATAATGSCANTKSSSPSSSRRATSETALRKEHPQHKHQSSSPHPQKTTASPSTPKSKRNRIMSILLQSATYDTMESGEDSTMGSKGRANCNTSLSNSTTSVETGDTGVVSASSDSSSSSGSEDDRERWYDEKNGTIWVKSPDSKKPHLELTLVSPGSTTSSPDAPKGRSTPKKRINRGSRSIDLSALSFVDSPGIASGVPQTEINEAPKPPSSVDTSYEKIQGIGGLLTKLELNVAPNNIAPVELPTNDKILPNMHQTRKKRESARSRAVKKSSHPKSLINEMSSPPSKRRNRKTRSRRSKAVDDSRADDGTTWVPSPGNSAKPHLELNVSAHKSLPDPIIIARDTPRLPFAPLLD